MKSLVLVAGSILFLAAGLGACRSSDESETSSEAYACSYNVNGKVFEGSTREECESGMSGQQGSQGPSTSTGVPGGKAMCSYNVYGTEVKGYSQAECNALASSLKGGNSPSNPQMPTTPGGMPQVPAGPMGPGPMGPSTPGPMTPSGGGGGAYSCSYNVNGVEERGDTEAECKALEKKYGNPFGGF